MYAFEENSKNMEKIFKIDKLLIFYQTKYMKLKKKDENKCQHTKNKIKQQ